MIFIQWVSIELELKSKLFQTCCTLLDLSSRKIDKNITDMFVGLPRTRNKCTCIRYADEVQLMFRLIKCFLIFRITKIVCLLSQLCICSNTFTARNKIYIFKFVNDNGDILYKSNGKILVKLKHSVHDESDRYILHWILELCNIY